MRSRWWAALALVAVVGVAAPACGGGDEQADPSERTSDPRATDPGGDGGEPGGGDSGEPGDGSSGGDQGGDGGGTGGDGDGDPGVVPELPELGSLGDCIELAGTWASLALSSMGGPDAAAEARQQAEDLKAQLPESLHDDLDVVADAFRTVAEQGVLDGAAAIDSPEFREANANIEQYLTENCG